MCVWENLGKAHELNGSMQDMHGLPKLAQACCNLSCFRASLNSADLPDCCHGMRVSGMGRWAESHVAMEMPPWRSTTNFESKVHRDRCDRV